MTTAQPDLIPGLRYAARLLRKMQLTPETYPYWSQRHAFADWLSEEAERIEAGKEDNGNTQ